MNKPAFDGLSNVRAGSGVTFTKDASIVYRKNGQTMSHDVVIWDLKNIRRTDTNSLLRMYDLATGVLNTSKFQQERVRADKASQRIAKELHKRNVAL